MTPQEALNLLAWGNEGKPSYVFIRNYVAALEIKLAQALDLAERRGEHMARQSQHLYDTRQKLRKVEEERERYRERCEQLEAALRGGEGK